MSVNNDAKKYDFSIESAHHSEKSISLPVFGVYESSEQAWFYLGKVLDYVLTQDYTRNIILVSSV